MAHHIVLLSLDALRADGLGCYGNPRNHTRNIDSVARESLLFRQATTPATWTLPAHMSMLSGLDPLVHGCRSSRYRYPPETLPFPLVVELLAEAGYAPLCITGGGYMEAPFGFGRGVPDFRVIGPIGEALAAAALHIEAHEKTFTFLHTYTVHDYPRVQSSPKLLEFMQIRDSSYKGFFPTNQDFHALITQLGDTPESPPVDPRDLAYLRDIYDAAVHIADTSLGSFLGRLMSGGRWPDTSLVLTSDHGESLGEEHMGRRRWHHGGPPYQEQLRIPLLIRPARHLADTLEPSEIGTMVSLQDLVPTLLDFAEVPYARDQFDGRSLLDLAFGQISAFETRRLFFHSCEDSEDRYLDPSLYGSAMIWRDGGKVIYDSRTLALREYYRIDEDPDERHNRIDDVDQDELKRMAETIAAYHQSTTSRARLPRAEAIDDPLVLERLAQLGYIDL